jgi:hypothetical protein
LPADKRLVWLAAALLVAVNKRFVWLATVLLIAATTSHAEAPSLTVADARAVVDQAIDLIAKNYVFPQARAGIVAKLRASEAAGRYDTTSASELVERLSPDLTAAGDDRHLWIKYDPAEHAALRQGHESHGAREFDTNNGRIRNQGYEELRILAGNVRYVNLTGFMWNGAATSRAVADVARFMGDGDAVIIDLRQNGGGSGAAVQALVSYFLPPDHRVLMTFHQGANGAAQSTHVIDALQGPRLVGKPLYVLTSGNTGSAAEEFAYHVRQFKLGTLVGGKTAGAANNDTLYPVGRGFVLSVSTGRPVHPVSHTNWQGVGVAVDVDVPDATALDEAHSLAIDRLAARPGADAAQYAWIKAGLAGSLHPPRIDAQALGEFTGRFGVRTITIANGTLIYQRDNRPSTALTPLAADLFAFANTRDERLRFTRTSGKITGFEILTIDGQVISVPRSA